MGKKLSEIAGARCSFCGREALPAKNGVDFLARGMRGFICKDCIRRCAELAELCPLGGVLKFSSRKKEDPK